MKKAILISDNTSINRVKKIFKNIKNITNDIDTLRGEKYDEIIIVDGTNIKNFEYIMDTLKSISDKITFYI
ncbi:MAG TPA: hypothetical protein VI911_09040 [Patescibacteria group bacterium]|nr:MAG: hypothetical protein UR43_C0005G0024 [candidate division TM6 bacterium GW2011_GWF2_33_332]HLD91143.1 hypothetical protein [Patescibacteria group bacterium]